MVVLSVDFLQIYTCAFSYLPAGPALIARFSRRSLLTVQRFGHDTGQGGFAGTANTTENHCMGDSILGQAVLQCTDNRFLADNIGKGLGA